VSGRARVSRPGGLDRRPRRWLPAVAALATLVATVAGCGSSPSGSGPRSTTETTAGAAAAAPLTSAPSCTDALASYAPDADALAGRITAGGYTAKIRARGRLVVGVSADTLPFGSRNPISGKIEGFDIDVLHQISQAVFGRPDAIEFRVITTAQRIPSLQGDVDASKSVEQAPPVDIVARTMSITCDRWKQIAFSSEYYHAGQRVLVSRDSPVTSIEGLKGKRVCAPKGSTSLTRLANYPGVVAVPADRHTDCLAWFQEGVVDAITGDDTVLAGFAAQDPYAKVVGPRFSDEPYGLGIGATHVDFVRFVNGVLARMRADGTWTRLYDTWLSRELGPAPAPPQAVYGRRP